MTKIGQDFTIWSGDSRDLVVTVSDENSASVNLTGASVVWVLSNDESSTSLVRKETGGSGIAISGCTFTVTLAPSDTSGLAGTYYHEAQVRNTSGCIGTVTVGTVIINKDVI